MARPIDDTKWVTSSFMIPSHSADIIKNRHNKLSSAFQKYTDTTPGGNFAINPPPQFTRTADLRVRGAYASGSPRGEGSRGMGRKYSELIDDNSQLIHMRFGVPQFNSLTGFFTGFYSPSAGSISRTGRSTSIFYDLGRVAGFVVSLPLQPFILAGTVYRFLANKPISKYYYLKPTMPLYWNAVNSIANGIAVNMGIVPRVGGASSDGAPKDYDKEADNINKDVPSSSAEEAQKYHSMLPDIFAEGGGVDVYALASRSQRLADAARTKMEERLKGVEESGALYEKMNAHANELPYMKAPKQTYPGINAYLKAWTGTVMGKVSGTEGDDDDIPADDATNNRGFFDKFADFAAAEIRDGGQFVTFRVNATGEVSETFANSAGESDIASKLNSTAAGVRSKKFNFANGNLTDNAIGNMAESVVSSTKDFIGGAAESIGVGGLAGLAFGNAFVDIPQEWKESSAELPKSTFTIELRSPYGNKMSRFLNLWMPLSMLLAGVLPKSTGKHSYDMPFLVEMYDKGRQQVRLGIIDSLNVTRGVGNLGWTQTGEPLGVNVSFSVLDLSSVIHMPINSSPGFFDEDNAYTDYLAVLGSLSMADQIYAGSRLRLNITRTLQNWKSTNSPAAWGQWAANTVPGQVLSAFAREASIARAGE